MPILPRWHASPFESEMLAKGHSLISIHRAKNNLPTDQTLTHFSDLFRSWVNTSFIQLLLQCSGDPNVNLFRHEYNCSTSTCQWIGLKEHLQETSGDGLLDFMSAVPPPPSPPPPRDPPDLNCKRYIAVFPAGPEQQAQDQSVPRRTLTASAWLQCSPPDQTSKLRSRVIMLDLNCKR